MTVRYVIGIAMNVYIDATSAKRSVQHNHIVFVSSVTTYMTTVITTTKTTV